MIVSNLQNSSRIEPLHPLFKQLFDYVKSHDLLHTPCGRIELNGDNLFINNVNPTCVKESEQVWKYIVTTLIYISSWKGKNVSVGKPLKM